MENKLKTEDIRNMHDNENAYDEIYKISKMSEMEKKMYSITESSTGVSYRKPKRNLKFSDDKLLQSENKSEQDQNRMTSHASERGAQTESVKLLETMIDNIRSNGFDKVRADIEEKRKIKKIIENNISNLENTIKYTKNSNKTNYIEYNNLIRERDDIIFIGDKAARDFYFINKEIPDLKQEIEKMNSEISLKHEELRYFRNDSLEADKEIASLKYNVQKLNKSNSDYKKERDNYRNGIALLSKHIGILKEKIRKQA